MPPGVATQLKASQKDAQGPLLEPHGKYFSYLVKVDKRRREVSLHARLPLFGDCTQLFGDHHSAATNKKEGELPHWWPTVLGSLGC